MFSKKKKSKTWKEGNNVENYLEKKKKGEKISTLHCSSIKNKTKEYKNTKPTKQKQKQ